MREFCKELNKPNEPNKSVQIAQSPRAGENIRRKGCEIKAGETVLPGGTRISPPILALIATLGLDQVVVHAKPKVAIVVTGDELVRPGNALKPGQIFDSNSYALAAALECLGIRQCPIFYAKDNLASTKTAFSEAFNSSDIVISSGGVSVGDHDYVKRTLEEMGVRTIFWKVAIKPGKPVYFGILNENANTTVSFNDSISESDTQYPKLVFGLPGNPVSVLVTYHQLVKPALKKMMGDTQIAASLHKAQLTKAISKTPGRLDFLRAQISQTETGAILAAPVKGQDSHMLTGLANADCLLHFEAESQSVATGEEIQIDVLNWFD